MTERISYATYLVSFIWSIIHIGVIGIKRSLNLDTEPFLFIYVFGFTFFFIISYVLGGKR
jgi:hypothetical protein